MELVDVVDSKSTAGDSVPVRVRSPAPGKRAAMPLFCIYDAKEGKYAADRAILPAGRAALRGAAALRLRARSLRRHALPPAQAAGGVRVAGDADRRHRCRRRGVCRAHLRQQPAERADGRPRRRRRGGGGGLLPQRQRRAAHEDLRLPRRGGQLRAVRRDRGHVQLDLQHQLHRPQRRRLARDPRRHPRRSGRAEPRGLLALGGGAAPAAGHGLHPLRRPRHGWRRAAGPDRPAQR